MKQQEQMRLQEKVAQIEQGGSRFEPLREVVLFSNRAADWFSHGDMQSKRMILQTVGSNLTLTSKKLNIQAQKPFESLAQFAHSPRRLAIVDVVRTFWHNDFGEGLINNIRTLRARFEADHPSRATTA